MSNCLGPDQARHFVGPDLGTKYLWTTLVRKELIISRCLDSYKNLISRY